MDDIWSAARANKDDVDASSGASAWEALWRPAPWLMASLCAGTTPSVAVHAYKAHWQRVLPQVGLATIAAAVQRAGGSINHPGSALDEALEQRAAFIEGGAGPEASSIGTVQSYCRLPQHSVCTL